MTCFVSLVECVAFRSDREEQIHWRVAS
jgi:hypothetical protein